MWYLPMAYKIGISGVKMLVEFQYLAFEIDPSTAEMARERVRNTQPPLFVPEAEQLTFVTPD
jgi:hypothetical protein